MKQYEELEMEVILFEAEDIITSSGDDPVYPTITITPSDKM